MKIHILLMAAILIGLNFSSCTKINADGPVLKEARPITGFSVIHADIPGAVYIRQDSVFSVVIHAQQAIINALNTSLVDSVLKISFGHNVRLGAHDEISVYISCPVLAALQLRGSGAMYCTNKLNASALALRVEGSGFLSLNGLQAGVLTAALSGSGDIEVSQGAVEQLRTDISGSGNIYLSGLQSKFAHAHTSGSGDTKLHVSTQLEAAISGSGNVYYTGQPSVFQHISGSGRLISF